MVRITKLTDYGVMIMAFMASSPTQVFQAREIAEQTSLAQPTVSKLLKKLVKHQLLTSQRGSHGGYQLACHPSQTTIADLIQILEGPIAITECSLGHDHCSSAPLCSVKSPWQRVNDVITQALQSVKLADLIYHTAPILTPKTVTTAIRVIHDNH